jgi:hypothetical protein
MAEQRPEQSHVAEGQAPPLVPNFFHIVETFAVPALIWTGHLPNPVDEKAPPNLDLARYQIGMLELLEKKTKGNLDKDEETFLGEMLHAARVAFVRAKEKMAQEKQAEMDKSPLEEKKS